MKFKKPFVMGVDAGTGSIRVGIFDINGNPVVFANQEYETYFPKPGWAEQNPDEWWSSLKIATKKALKESGVNPEDIIAIGADGTSSTVVCLDENGVCLRPAILWMDNRSSKQAQKIFNSKHSVLKRSKAGVSAEWMIPKALWIKENEKHIYDDVKFFMEQVDWLNFKLTGETCLSINHITHRWFYNCKEGGWPIDFYNEIGLDGFVEKLPKNILKLGEVVGKLSKSVANELGLKPGVLVAEGGCDAYIGMLGLNVVKPGRAALIAGSSHLFLPITDKEIYVKGIFGIHPDCVVPGLNVMEGGQVSSGSIIRWFKDNYTKKEEIEAQEKGISHYGLLNQMAEKLPIGSEGLIVLDYWQGNRNPYTDYLVQGAIWGLTLKHKTGHIFRAIMEGVAFGTENILRILSGSGLEIDAVRISGGIAKSDLWLKIHADVTNVPFIVPEFTESTILGSAICASVGADIYKNVTEASNNMVRMKRIIEPNEKNHEEYEFYFDKYRRTYFVLKELMHEMANR